MPNDTLGQYEQQCVEGTSERREDFFQHIRPAFARDEVRPEGCKTPLRNDGVRPTGALDFLQRSRAGSSTEIACNSRRSRAQACSGGGGARA